MRQWDRTYARDGRIWSSIQEDVPEVARLLKKNGKKKVLDLGFGTGRHVEYLASNGLDVFGIDISDAGMEITKERLKQKGLKARLRIGNIYDPLPYPDRFFDAIVSTQVLHHAKIESIQKLILEMERILKPHGIVFITVPSTRKTLRKATKSKLVAPHTYMPLDGDEKGLLHFYFTEKLIRKHFCSFEIERIWKDKGRHYCFLARLKAR